MREPAAILNSSRQFRPPFLRRRFVRDAASPVRFLRAAALGCVVACAMGAGPRIEAETVRLVTKTPLGPAATRAADALRMALRGRGLEVVDGGTTETPEMIVVGILGADPTFDERLTNGRLEPNERREAAVVRWSERTQHRLIVAGGDDRGLAYALHDAARGISTLPQDRHWSQGVVEENGQPFLRVRNVSLHLFNADCEREWFFSESFWRDYFARLALARFNRCTLTFADQTNYLCPVYPNFVALPEYPQVRVEGLTEERRAANADMLRRIAAWADEYAVDFDLGVWMQAPVPRWSGKVRVSGLPEGLAHSEYCALGLRRLLAACPSIDGVQLRMNEEAGVSADRQTDFHRPMFRALRALGRPVRVELRYKGLQAATVRAAQDEGLDVTVSTKFWSEHLGGPYHPTVVDSHWSADRYGFGTLLRKPRSHRVSYQLWNVGSQRLTSWGDPAYAAQFARSCKLGDGEGFEVFAPLTNKGYGDAPGAWPVIVDPASRVGRWEQERYWFFYLAFGRMGYDPEGTSPEVWRRELRHRFGEAASQDVEEAYRAASAVLPAVTTALLPGASEWSWWPEMDTGGNLREYSRIQTSDPGRYAAVRRWERTPDWRWEDWDVVPGFVDNALAGRVDSRIPPSATAGRLHDLAKRIERHRRGAERTLSVASAEWRMTSTDLRLLAALAEYHAHKLEAAVHWAFYEATNDPRRLVAVVAPLEKSVEAWRRAVAATEGVYAPDLVFGIAIDSPRSKFGHHHTGHWRDRLPELEADLQRIREAAKPLYVAGNGPPPDVAGEPIPARVPDGLVHRPPQSATPDEPLELRLATPRDVGPLRCRVRWRPLDQTQAWRTADMQPTAGRGGTSEFVAELAVPSAEFDLQYYFEVEREGAIARWGEVDGVPYFVVPVEPRRP